MDTTTDEIKRRVEERARKAREAHGIPPGIEVKYERETERDEFPKPLSIGELLDGKFPQPQFLVQDWIMQGAVNIFPADGGIGKTTLATMFATAVAAGVPILGKMTKQAPALIVLCEDGNGITQTRVNAVIDREKIANPRALQMVAWCLDNGADATLCKINDEGRIEKRYRFLDMLESQIAKMPGCFVVLDSLIDVVEMSMRDPAPANTFYKKVLTPLCRKYGCTILVLQHPSKASMADGTYIHGTLAHRNAVRHGIAARKEKGQSYIVLWPIKHNYTSEEETRLYFEFPIFTRTRPQESENETVRREAAILDYILDLIRRGKPHVSKANNSSGETPDSIARTLTQSGALGTVHHKEVKSIMLRAEGQGVIEYLDATRKRLGQYRLVDPEDRAADVAEFNDAGDENATDE